MMSKLQSSVVALLVIGMAVVVLWQRQQARRLRSEIAFLREQVEQATELRESNRHLSEELKAGVERAQEADKREKANLDELLQLRGRVAMARQIEQENTRLKAQRDPLAEAALQMYRDFQATTGLSDQEMEKVAKQLPDVQERIGRETAAVVGLRGVELLSSGDREKLEKYLARWVGNYYQAYYTNGGDAIIARIERAAGTNQAIAAAIETAQP